MTKLNTNFNVSPWFDDYYDVAEEKNYHRILFKPTVAVQARELTQLQSILQEQISRFGSYNFKDGSVVDRCAITYVPNYPVVYVSNQFDSNNDLNVLDIPTDYLLVSNSGVRATISSAKSGFELTYPETNRFYLNYIYTGSVANSDVFEFTSGEKIYVYSDLQSKFGSLDANNLVDSISVITANATANATATAYGITVSDGIIFQKGFFINVNEHTIPVRDHDQNVNNYVVGFNTLETIVNSNQDSSLVSNAAGFPNYLAPGADRLKLEATLVSKPRSDTANSKNFFAIAEFDSNRPTENNTGEEGLNKILDVLSIRTGDSEGDFTVKPFYIETEAHASNTQLFEYKISPGVTYINGYRIEKLNSFNVTNEKATTVKEAETQIITGNYGNYILVDEMVGVFDFDNVDEVVFYDTAQNSVSEYENSSTAPSGSIVGYGNILSVQYDSGTKGTPEAKYKIYITNIRMNSTKSFANDVKSLYAASSFGDAKADAVLENSLAVIKDSSRTSLVFPFGVDSIKRLRDSGGDNETSFIFRDITSATMAANGFVTFTINSPANGGEERINVSPGVMSASLALNFNIKTSNAAYSANLAGTIDNGGNTTLVGTGTAFATDFEEGNTIRVNTGAGFQVRRITDIANNTSLTIDAVIATTNATCNFQKYYTGGSVIDVDSINVISNTQFIVDTNLDAGTGTVDSGTQTLYAEYPVLRTNAVETKKEINKNIFVKIDCSNNVAEELGPWDLGLVDVAKVRNVYVGTTYDITNPERSNWFTFDNGQRDNVYDHAKLILKPSYKSKLSSSSKILVELDHFIANTTTGVGFFSVDSYPIDDANTANTIAIKTEEIPRYFSGAYSEFLDLRNSIDFRPRKFNTANSTNSVASATINPVVSNTSFNVSGSGQYVIDPDTNLQADMEYYLPRRDLIVINRFGDISIRKGEPGENPVIPINEKDTAVIAESYVTAYPSLSDREAADSNRKDLMVKQTMKTNRVYTHKDVGALDDRISRMEYYATLNMLEQKAKDLVITDENGLDRFKNGIYADSFLNHSLGKVNDIEYSISIDKDLGIARPLFKDHAIDYKFREDLSSGVARTGNLLTRPYTHELFIDQRYATNTRNCTGSAWAWNGKLNLYPTYDHFKDTIETEPVNVVQDLTTGQTSGQTFGEWRTVTTTNNSSGSNIATTTSERVITNTTVTNKSSTIETGKYVTDVTSNPFIRSREISFIASGMKPNTTVHMFFDNVNVDEYCAPGVLSGLADVEAGQENKVLNRSGNFGDTLKSDSSGNVYGIFKIPAETFKSGDREFVVTNVDDLIVDAGSILTSSKALYTASSISITTGSTTLTTLTSEVNTSVTVNTRSTSQAVSTGGRESRGNNDRDPIAQSFTVSAPSNVSGTFISKLGVFFKTKDPTLGCSIFIINTELGIPDASKILGRAYLNSTDITTSSDASSETEFVFVNPVYLENNKEYAFMVKPDGDSPEYTIWISNIGNYDIITGEQVYSNPYTGILFVSANMNTWTANQTEDIKFRIYRAKFSVGTGTAIFNNEDDEYLTINGLTKANNSFNVEVGDAIIKVVANTRISNTANVFYSEGRVQYVDEAEDIIHIDSSNGNLADGDIIEFHRAPDSANMLSYNANTLIATTNVVSIDNLTYHAVVPRFASITPSLTSSALKFKGTDTSYSFDAEFKSVKGETDNEYDDKSRIAVSRSNEVVSMAGEKSSVFSISLTTENTYTTPVIDLRRKSSLFIENIINNDSSDEHTRYGAAITKYVSQNIVLDDAIGQAEDLHAFVGGYRPVGTDIEVYVKVLGADDGDNFDDKLWTKMAKTEGSEKLYSSPINTSDYRELQYRIPEAVVASEGSKTTAYLNDGIIQYARNDGSIVVGYKTYCFKIVLLSENSAKIPKLSDFRAISLQK